MNRIGVIGAGAFGTALACAFARDGNRVFLWGRDAVHMENMQEMRENRRYLAGIPLPETVMPTANMSDLAGSKAIILALPAQPLRGFLDANHLNAVNCPLVLSAKGLESGTGKLQSQILREQQVQAPLAVISGPGFASEIAIGKPTALSIACDNQTNGEQLQSILSTTNLRLYLTSDVTGVQLGGALKNVYAIACGIVVGADLGESARAALLTRGFAEMSALARAMGAKAETLAGLSGIGDLALTCNSPQSRNFSFGAELAQNGKFGTQNTVEGIATARAVVALSQKHQIEMPIAQAVTDVLEKKVTVGEALQALMARPLKEES